MNINGFLASLAGRDLSPNTIDAYRRELEHFQRFIRERRLRVTSVTPRVVLEYSNQFDSEPSKSGAAKRRRLAALSSFFEYMRLMTDGRMRNPVDVIPRPKRQPPNPHPVEEPVLGRLTVGVTNKRDKAIIKLFVSSGLRLSELASLNVDSISVEVTSFPTGKRVLGVGRVIGKGNKERDFLVDFETLKAINEYRQERGQDDNPALFLSNRKRRISPRAVEHMLKSWCRKLQLPDIHPHALRHSASTIWHRRGIGTLEISRILGHSSAATTEQYIKTDMPELRAQYFAAMENVDSPSLPKSPKA